MIKRIIRLVLGLCARRAASCADTQPLHVRTVLHGARDRLVCLFAADQKRRVCGMFLFLDEVHTPCMSRVVRNDLSAQSTGRTRAGDTQGRVKVAIISPKLR